MGVDTGGGHLGPGGGAEQGEEQDGEEHGLGEPDGVGGEALGDDGSGGCADKKTKADEPECAELLEALAAGGWVAFKPAVEQRFWGATQYECVYVTLSATF